MKVYTIEVENTWDEIFYVDSVCATREIAVSTLKAKYGDLVYHEKYEYYSAPGSSTDFYIREYNVI